MILVTGATGPLGTAVVRNLLKKIAADQIATLVRDESKAAALKEMGVDVRVGNYNDTASLDKAMQGIEKVLLISGIEHNVRQQHQNVINAAKKAGVQCVAYTSRALRDRNTLTNQYMLTHFETEDDLKASGLNYAIFRNILYMDTVPNYVGGKVFDRGIYLPAGQGRVSFALRSDMGEAIANVLLQDNCDNRIYKLTGSETYSFDDIAAVLTDLSGKQVNYTPIEKSAYEEQLKTWGTPEFVLQLLVGFLTDIKNGQEEEVSPELENLLGRKPASLKEGLKVLFKL